MLIPYFIRRYAYGINVLQPSEHRSESGGGMKFQFNFLMMMFVNMSA